MCDHTWIAITLLNVFLNKAQTRNRCVTVEDVYLGRFFFLKSGLTCVCLKSSGNMSKHTDALMIFVVAPMHE